MKLYKTCIILLSTLWSFWDCALLKWHHTKVLPVLSSWSPKRACCTGSPFIGTSYIVSKPKGTCFHFMTLLEQRLYHRPIVKRATGISCSNSLNKKFYKKQCRFWKIIWLKEYRRTYAMNINETMNKNIIFQHIITTTQMFGTQWYLYQKQK